jgi:spore coat protein U-like protein
MRALILAALLALAPAAATAAPPMPSPNCLMNVQSLDFGLYNRTSIEPNTSVGAIQVKCLGVKLVGAAFRVLLRGGASDNPIDRFMTRGDKVLHYNIYVDPGRRQIAGDLTDYTFLPRTRARLGSPLAIYRLYGAIPPGQLVPAGEYTDTLQIEVEF